MGKAREIINVIWGSCGAFLGWFLGGGDGLLYALLTFIVIDYITGVMCGVVDHNLSSEIGFSGLLKKVFILCIVGIGHITDLYIIQHGEVLRSAAIFFYMSNEGISILENAVHLKLPVPNVVKQALEKIHETAEKTSVEIPPIAEGEKHGEKDESRPD